MNHTSEYEFTIIVPVYNEQDNIDRLEKAFRQYLPAASRKSCVLFVDDGSTDDSLEGLRRICGRNSGFYYLAFLYNEGLSAALKAGIDHAESPLVGYLDADLQTRPEDFERLLPLTADHELVTGIRAGRKDSPFKRFQSKFANAFRRMMTHDGATDTGCPLKVMRTPAARRLPLFRGMHRFLPALILLQEGASYAEIPVPHYPRTAGVSKFHLWNRLIAPLMDCFAYRWMRKRAINYRVGQSNL